MTMTQNDMTSAPQALLDELAQCLAALREQPGVPQPAWRELHEKISAQTFNLVVAGQFKRGKSSLINALLGDELLPVGVVPLTSVVTILSAGETTQVEVEFEDGHAESVPLERLAEYVTEKGNPKNVKQVRLVHIRHPSPWLRGGVRLVDTPGIGSVYRHNTDVAYGFLPKADAVLFVLSVDQPLSQAEHDFLKEIAGYAARVFVLLNKTDLLSSEELRESLQFTAGALAELMGGPVRLFPVSARAALRRGPHGAGDGHARSGFADFTRALSAFLMQEKGAALAAVAARHLARLAEQARFSIELERQSLAMPLEALRGKLQRFEERKGESLGARQDYITLIEAEGRRLVREIVEPDLEAFQGALQERMGTNLARHLREHPGLPARQLYQTLEGLVSAEIKQAYDEFRITEDAKVARAFDALCARFTVRINATIDELQRFAADLFSIPFAPVPAESLWKFESGFYYKFWTEPPGLEIILSSAALSLPGVLGERVVRRRIERRAAELIEIHAGRMRYDLVQRIEHGVRAFQTLVAEQIDATVAGIETAVRKGLDIGQSTQREIEARTAGLLAARETLESVRSRIERVRRTLAEAFSFDTETAAAAPPHDLRGGAA
jgi:GTP-binding protein EngB required for normal cell division